MKKMMQWVFAATLIISGMSVLTACSSDDDNNNNPPVQPEDDGGNSGTTSSITYIERSWDGTQVVDKEVTAEAQWLNAVAVEKYKALEIEGLWYVTGNYEITNSPIKAKGDLRIILCDDAVFKPSYIDVGGGNSVRIYGQKRGTGQLYIDAPQHCPAIGSHNSSGGTIEIHGGAITVIGAGGSAAIGGCYYEPDSKTKLNYSFDKIKIYGGSINALGGNEAAAIGGSYEPKGKGTVEIYGGDIVAVGGKNKYGGPGIGGGQHGFIEKVDIYGGNIISTGSDEAAGIGCGQGDRDESESGKGIVNIYGGNVKAYGGARGAGIGGGDHMCLAQINISGGKVYAYAGADGAGIGGGEDGDGGTITISGGLVFAYGNVSSGFGAGIGGGQDGNSGTITISGGEVHAYGGDDAAGIGTGEETTSGPNIKADNITISGGAVEAVGGGKGAGVGAGQDAEVGTITITMDSGSVYVSGRSGDDCGWWAGAFGAYDEDDRGTLNIGKGVKTMSIEKDYSWSTIPVAWNPVAFAQQRCHVQILTCDHPGGQTAQTCVFCKH